jgi:DNA primase small subunit
MRKFVANAASEDLRNIGLNSKTSTAILANKEKIQKRCIDEGLWDSVREVNIKTWARIAEYVKNLESAKIDTVVTTDIHRLIRLAGSLHGKTGLKKVEFPVSRLTDFDPFKEAVAFKEGAVKVFVSGAPEFRLGEREFGPYRNKTVELPTAAAVLLICKGRAEVVK